MNRVIVVSLTILFFTACAVMSTSVGTESTNPLVGAWEITERVVGGGANAGTYTDLQPGIRIFTERHYSEMRFNNDDPRSLIPEGVSRADLTDAEWGALTQSINANSGIYELAGERILFRPLVSLSPNLMNDRVFFME